MATALSNMKVSSDLYKHSSGMTEAGSVDDRKNRTESTATSHYQDGRVKLQEPRGKHLIQ